MALDYIRNGDDPRLLQMAQEIVTYQSSEIGAMNTYLAQWGHAATRRRRPWAGCSRRSRAARCPGSRRRRRWTSSPRRAASSSTTSSPQLMINHHAGGVHMAAYAADARGEAVDPRGSPPRWTTVSGARSAR